MQQVTLWHIKTKILGTEANSDQSNDSKCQLTNVFKHWFDNSNVQATQFK